MMPETPAAPATTGTPTPPATPAPPPWHQGVDADILGTWQNKGWDTSDPAKIAIEASKSYREAEKMIGVPKDQLLRIPAKPDDTAAWKALYQRLGAPADAKDYDVSPVTGEGWEPSLADALRQAFSARNVTKDAASDITKALAKWFGDEESASNIASEAKKTTELVNLKQQWGAHYDSNLLEAKKGALGLGLTEDQVRAFEGIMGYDKAAELFRKIGSLNAEDQLVTGVRTGSPTTVDQATARVNDLRTDPDFQRRLFAGEATARREWANLHEQIAGVSEAAELAALGRR
jgi:hypothetical protein